MNSYNADYLIDDGSINWGTVESSHHTFSYPNQIGEFLSSTTIGTRTITVFGWIIGSGSQPYEQIKRKKRILNKLITPCG
jgi:hypothetical protein